MGHESIEMKYWGSIGELRIFLVMDTILQHIVFIGAPGVTRTRGTRIRNPSLYPPELRGHWLTFG